MLVGYGRVSTQDQNLDLQCDALTKAGCEKVFTDVISGIKEDRAGLKEAFSFMRRGDVLIVWRLDRLGRSLKNLIENVNQLGGKGIGFRSLQESIDTITSGGKLIFHMFGALAEFERDVIRERTQAGLQAARARGRKGGRPRALEGKKLALALSMYEDLNQPPKDICETLGISRSALYRSVSQKARQEAKPSPSKGASPT